MRKILFASVSSMLLGVLLIGASYADATPPPTISCAWDYSAKTTNCTVTDTATCDSYDVDEDGSGIYSHSDTVSYISTPQGDVPIRLADYSDTQDAGNLGDTNPHSFTADCTVGGVTSAFSSAYSFSQPCDGGSGCPSGPSAIPTNAGASLVGDITNAITGNIVEVLLVLGGIVGLSIVMALFDAAKEGRMLDGKLRESRRR